MVAEALPGTSLKHTAYGLGETHMGVTDHQAHTREAALFEAAQNSLARRARSRCRPTAAPAALTAVIVEAPGHDDGPGADLQRLPKPAVEIRHVEVEIRVTGAIQWPLQERLDLLIKPLAVPLTSEREIPAWEPIAATGAATLRMEMPLTQSSMISTSSALSLRRLRSRIEGRKLPERSLGS